MKEMVILLSRILPRLGIICWADMVLPAVVGAAWPPQGHAAVQPVLVTALAFTSLVLFLIYIFTRKQAATKTASPTGRTPEKRGSHVTARVLERLVDQHDLAMVKLSLDGYRILDANPSLLNALGVEKDVVLNENGTALGLVRPRREDMQHLMARGFCDTQVSLFNRQSNDFERCRVLNIVCRSGTPPFIMAIVTGLSGKVPPDALPGCIHDILNARTIFQ